MKRWVRIFVIVAIIMLGACSEPVTPVDHSLTAEEVYDLAMEQVSHFRSASVAMTLKQTKRSGTDEQMVMSADFSGELMAQPFKVHQTGNVSFQHLPLGQIDLDAELYVADDLIYVHDNMFDDWVKANVNDLQDFGIHLGEEHSLWTILEQVGTSINLFTLEQTNDTFIFTLEPNTEQFQEHLIEEIRFVKRINFTGAQKKDENEVDHADTVDVSFSIDQESYHMLSFDIEVHTEMMEDEETTPVTTSIGVEFSNINELEDITVPEQVIDEAIEEHPLLAP